MIFSNLKFKNKLFQVQENILPRIIVTKQVSFNFVPLDLPLLLCRLPLPDWNPGS